MEGLRVPHSVVEAILKEIDPAGTTLRRRRRLRRRQYTNPGPNFAWHIDGYDKLKPWGFPIHGSVDGFSRHVLWLNVTSSNKSPDNIAAMYLKSVEELGGCSVELVTDPGTENGIAAAMQCYFRDNDLSHRYVPSPRNQRIEGWWSFFARQYASWWRTFFADLEFRRIIDMSSTISKECLRFSFSSLLQRDLDNVKEHWNTHFIRRSRHDTVQGRPNSLYFLPDIHGGERNLLLQVERRELDYVSHHVILPEPFNEYQEYFTMVQNSAMLPHPTNWREALNLYHTMVHISEAGID